MKNFKDYIKEDFDKKIDDPYNEEIDDDDVDIKEKEASDAFNKIFYDDDDFDFDIGPEPEPPIEDDDDDYIDDDDEDDDIELKVLNEYTETIIYKTVKFDKFPEHEISYKITYDDDGFAFVDFDSKYLPNNITNYLIRNSDNIRDILLKR